MKNKVFIFVVFIILFLPIVNATDIFFDGFESGSLSGWSLSHAAGAVDWVASTTNPPGSYQGSWYAFGRPMDTDDPASTMERIISTSVYTNINFSYYRKLNLGTASHTFRAKWFDGSTWTAVEDVTGTIADSSYVSKSFLLPSNADNNANFAIKFECTEGTTTKDCNVDNVNISGASSAPDTTPPNVNIIYPQNVNYNVDINEINYTVEDANDCWYSTNAGTTNTTIACGTNLTSLTSNEGSNTWLVGANDSNNNKNVSYMTFFKDTIYPLISYGQGTEDDGANISRNWIYANVSFTEANFENITFLLKNSSAVINETTFTTETYAVNWTNLLDGEYYYNISIFDIVGNFNSTETRKITLDMTAPFLSIAIPEAKTYGYNESLSLNFSVYDLNLQVCWYKVINSSDFLIIDNTTLANCENATFNISDGSHALYIYANDSFGNLQETSVNFSVITTAPAINLIYPIDNSFLNYKNNVYFNYSISSGLSLSVCELWGDFSGQFVLNQTDTNPGNDDFFILNLTSGNYNWGIVCNDTQDRKSNVNSSFDIDATAPNLTILQPAGTKTSRTDIVLTYTVSDANLGKCWYNVEWSTGGIVIANTTLPNCLTTTFGVSADGSYVLNLYANDSAGNLNSSSSSFSVSTSTGGGGSSGSTGSSGGGGGAASPITKIIISDIGNAIMNPGETKTLSINVKNNWFVYLNNCKLSGGGEASSWISNSQTEGLAAGQSIDFVFTIAAPNDALDEVGATIFIKCDEASASQDFTISISKTGLKTLIKNIEQSGKTLKFDYLVQNNGEENSLINVEYWLVDEFDKKDVSGSDNFALVAGEEIEKNGELDLSNLVAGTYALVIKANSEKESVSTQEDVIIGASSLAGRAIFGAQGGTIISILFMVVVAGIIAFFIVRNMIKKIGKSDRADFVKQKLGKRKEVSEE